MPVSTCLAGSSDRAAVLGAVVLDEHQIPQLDVPGAVAVDAALVAGDACHVAGCRAAVEVDFAARAAGAGLAHLPEVFFLAEAAHSFARQAADLEPELLGFVVVEIDRGVEFVFRQTPLLGQQFPGPVDRLGFVVVAERPVAEHLEKRVVIGVAADVFEIVVLAADADALLRAGGARVGSALLAEKNVLELDHAGVGEQQRRVVVGHQRRAAHHGVALLTK